MNFAPADGNPIVYLSFAASLRGRFPARVEDTAFNTKNKMPDMTVNTEEMMKSVFAFLLAASSFSVFLKISFPRHFPATQKARIETSDKNKTWFVIAKLEFVR